MIVLILSLGVVHLFTVVGLLIAGYVLLVVPAFDRPHYLVPARFMHLGMVGGHAVDGILGLVTCGAFGSIILPWVGSMAGGVGGFVVGQVARVVLVRRDER